MTAIQPIVLDRLSALAARGYTLSAWCEPCRRWADLDLPAVIERHGDRDMVGLRTRCAVCGAKGALQVRPPMREGYPL